MEKEIIETTKEGEYVKGIETTLSFYDGLNFEGGKFDNISIETLLYSEIDKKETYRTIGGSKNMDAGSIIKWASVLCGPDEVVSKENAFLHHFTIVNNLKKLYFNQH